MAYAILSDIHGNVGALHAVLEDIESEGIDTIYCLGDIIGYGPEPRECLQIAMDEFVFSLKGNHEHGILFEPIGFNETAAISAEWTREQLNDPERDRDQNHSFWNFLGDLPAEKKQDDIHYVHASPVDPTGQYVLPADIRNTRKMRDIFDRIEQTCFGGHTHIPGVFEKGRDEFLRPDMLEGSYDMNRAKALINVGSVGQPRDGNTDACYVIISDEEVQYRRVSYPVRETAEKIWRHKGLPNVLAKRLLSGQ